MVMHQHSHALNVTPVVALVQVQQMDHVLLVKLITLELVTFCYQAQTHVQIRALTVFMQTVLLSGARFATQIA